MAEKQLLSASVIKSLQKKAEEMKKNSDSGLTSDSVQETPKKIEQKVTSVIQQKSIDLSKNSFSALEITDDILSALIEKDRSFEITGLEADGAMTQMIVRLEKVLEKQRKRCRVYTAVRLPAQLRR